MINGLVYDYESIKLVLPSGLSIMSEKISYGDKKDDEVVYGSNGLPVGIGRGEYSGDFEIEFGRAEYETLNLFTASSGGFYNSDADYCELWAIWSGVGYRYAHGTFYGAQI
jgi:hypothetical protein